MFNCILLMILFQFSKSLPLNEFSYIQNRNELKESERLLRANDVKLDDKEEIVNQYMKYLKQNEFEATKDNFYLMFPIERELEQIYKSSVYEVLSKLPKGGNLHAHEEQLGDRKKLLKYIFELPEYDYLYICVNENGCDDQHMHSLDLFMKAPNSTNWAKVKGNPNYEFDKLIELTTFSGILNKTFVYQTDTNKRWDLGTRSFLFYSSIVSYDPVRLKYIETILDDERANNVQFIELRRMPFGENWYFGENGTKIFVEVEIEIENLLKFRLQYTSKYSEDFVDFVEIYNGVRFDEAHVTFQKMKDAIQLQKEYPSLITGFDMSAREEKGHTKLYYLDGWLSMYNERISKNDSIQFLLHNSETNWPDDYLISNYGDNVATLENVFDAVLVGAKRLGHALGFIKHPALIEYLKKKNIAIEVCPTSNQMLGHVPDLRQHPAINYIRNGIPIVLGTDDDGSFGSGGMTVQWYVAFMGWGLDLADLKQLAINSIKYSSISEASRIKVSKLWNKKWRSAIDSIYKTACSTKIDTQINITRVLPSYGPSNQSNKITIYGYGFEKAICKSIHVYFGDISTKCKLESTTEITCFTPIITLHDASSLNSKLIIKINSTEIIETNKVYKFINSGY